jgi:hypothetical protein
VTGTFETTGYTLVDWLMVVELPPGGLDDTGQLLSKSRGRRSGSDRKAGCAPPVEVVPHGRLGAGGNPVTS